jgi:hypothetical protein
VNLLELSEHLNDKLGKQLPSRVFLDNLRVIDEESRKSAAYTDPRYLPFYYFLGTKVTPVNLVELGFRLGLTSALFLKGCRTVQKFLAFQEKPEEYYSPRLGKANVKSNYRGDFHVHVGSVNDDAFMNRLQATGWDLAIVNEEVSYDKHRLLLDLLWAEMRREALIICDYVTRHRPTGQAYFDFCKSRNREPLVIETRYGVGIVQK